METFFVIKQVNTGSYFTDNVKIFSQHIKDAKKFNNIWSMRLFDSEEWDIFKEQGIMIIETILEV